MLFLLQSDDIDPGELRPPAEWHLHELARKRHAQSPHQHQQAKSKKGQIATNKGASDTVTTDKDDIDQDDDDADDDDEEGSVAISEKAKRLALKAKRLQKQFNDPNFQKRLILLFAFVGVVSLATAAYSLYQSYVQTNDYKLIVAGFTQRM